MHCKANLFFTIITPPTTTPLENTSLAAPGVLAHRLQHRTACNTSLPTLSKMADRVQKYVKPYSIGHSGQL